MKIKLFISLLIMLFFILHCTKGSEDGQSQNNKSTTNKDIITQSESTNSKSKNNNKHSIESLDKISDSLYLVRKNLYRGFIDSSGKIIIELKYRKAKPFSEGLAVFGYDLKNEGYIDIHGNVIIEPIYKLAESFHEGLASVSKEENSKSGYIDKNGDLIIDYKFELGGNFSEGLAAISLDPQFSKFGFINKQGDIVIEPQWELADDFHEGLCVVGNFIGTGYQVYGSDEGQHAPLYGYINTEGELAIEIKYGEASNFKNGIANVIDDENGQHFIDKSGTPVLLEITEGRNVYQFNEGIARFMDRETSLWGYLDKKGNIIVPAIYSDVKDFEDSLAAICNKETKLWGIIDKTGKTIIEPKYIECDILADGLIYIQTNMFENYLINNNGEIVWSYQ